MKTITIDGIEYAPVQKEEKKFPQVGDSYWAIEEKPVKYVYAEVEFCIKNIKSGNCYKTKEQAQAVYDLRCHIKLYKNLIKNSRVYWLSSTNDWVSFIYDGVLKDVADYNAGIVLPYAATEKIRAERLRLLKLAYNI